MSGLPTLPELADRFNRETPYTCVCREGGAEIQVADMTLWFDEDEAREILHSVLFLDEHLVERAVDLRLVRASSAVPLPPA